MISAKHILDSVSVDDGLTLLRGSPDRDRNAASVLKMILDDEDRAGAILRTAGTGS